MTLYELLYTVGCLVQSVSWFVFIVDRLNAEDGSRPDLRRIPDIGSPKPPRLVIGHGVCWWEHSDGSLELGPDRSGVFFDGPRKNWP